MESSMTSLRKKLHSPPVFDTLFGLAAITSLAGVVIDVGRSYPAIEAAKPLPKGGALLAVILASLVLSIVSARSDRQMADDFVYNTLKQSALVGMMTFFFTLAVWQALLAHQFGAISSYGVIAVLIACWSLSYFYTRIRGTNS